MVKATYGNEVSSFVNKNRDKQIILLIGGTCFACLLIGFFLGLFFFVNKNIIIILSVVSLIPLFYVTEIAGDRLNLWRSGSRGESEVFAALKYGLNSSYILFSDLKPPKTKNNVDFVVVGPTGVFAIEVKNDRGKIGFDGTKLTKNDKFFNRRCPTKQAKGQARQVHDIILEKTGLNIFVSPVVVFSSNYSTLPTGVGYYNDCYVVLIKDLFEVIEKRGKTLEVNEIDAIERSLRTT